MKPLCNTRLVSVTLLLCCCISLLCGEKIPPVMNDCRENNRHGLDWAERFRMVRESWGPGDGDGDGFEFELYICRYIPIVDCG